MLQAVFGALLEGYSEPVVLLHRYLLPQWHNTCLGKYGMPIHLSKHCLCSEQVSIICSDLGGWWHTVQGNLEEIEEESALVLSDWPISPGKKVRICCGSKQLRGTVESCAHDDVLGFLVEV